MDVGSLGEKGILEMLVLSRKAGQQVVLPGCGVTISVVQIGKNRVRLGIVAPHGTVVHRDEIWQRVCDEAAANDPPARACVSQ